MGELTIVEQLFSITLQHYLVLSVLLFGLGLLNLTSRKNAIAVLMGVELILNSANINLIAFARYSEQWWEGHTMVIFVIVLAAAEAAVALAIVLQMYRRFKDVDVDETDTLHG